MSPKTALVIEDDEDVAGFLKLTIEMLGYRVTVAQTGAAALRELVSLVPRLVLLDLHLPDMLGEDILRLIRDDALLRPSKVVVLTGTTQPADWSVRARADLILTKPIDAQTLSQLISRLEASQPGASA